MPFETDWKLADTNWDEFCKQRSAWEAAMEVAVREDITLPHAGESFYLRTLEQFKDMLLTLRAIGYNFPDYVLRAIDIDIEERDSE